MQRHSIEQFREAGWDEQNAAALLQYSEQLSARSLPVIFDASHLSGLLGVKVEYLYGVCNAPSLFYRRIVVSKASGGNRVLHEPLPTLKLVQRWILSEILEKTKAHKAAHAYESGRNIKKMMRIHRAKRHCVRLDFEKCFDNVVASQVYGFFASLGYFPHVSALLAGLCCAERGVAQGAPTSGALLNRVLSSFDETMLSYAQGKEAFYSRYADDLLFSSNRPFDVKLLVSVVSEVALPLGQKVNKRKTRVMGRGVVPQACGVVFGNPKLSVRKSLRREFSQRIHWIERNGISSEAARFEHTEEGYLNWLSGRLNWFEQIMGKQARFTAWRRVIRLEREALLRVQQPIRSS